jgi:uncharacterized protein
VKTLEFIVREISDNQITRREVWVPPAEIDLTLEEAHFVEEIHGHLELSRRMEDVYVKGSFSASVEVECRCCVEPFTTSILGDIEAQFYPTDAATPLDPWQAETGERYYLGDTIDLSEEVRQSLILEIPNWPICSEECKGLCPQCGENLNVIDCGCQVSAESSSPFAALADLLDQSDRALEN